MNEGNRRFVIGAALVLVLSGVLLLAGLRARTAQANQEAAAPLCRFGVNVLGDPDPFNLGALRMGWYVDYSATANPSKPNGADYMPIIDLTQVGDDDYDYNPKGSQLQAVIAGNPGASWLIGNEPDRREFQNDMLPSLYAAAYHELYDLIKTADPTAEIVAGTIVQPTPVRLLYLDMVLESYEAQFGEKMPVDAWSVHNFILNEVSCEHDPANCWGADIPPGIDWPHGEIVGIDENDDIDRFQERIWRFRRWMNSRGYRGLPLYVSEYGVLMPPEYGFDAGRVNDFMNATFEFMRTATDPLLGNPHDANRLVQRWSWYSSHDRLDFNGWLFDPDTYQISAMGQNYANYTAPIAAVTDLYPSRIGANPPAPFSEGQPVTVELQATIANSGNRVTPSAPATVRFYEGDPAQGQQIGSDQPVQLQGCGDNATVSVTWPDVAPGAHTVTVVVDVADDNTENNTQQQTILVATDRVFLSAILR